MYCMIHIQNTVYYRIFKHIHVLLRRIQSYCGIFRTNCNSCIFRSLTYSESWHLYNLRYISNSMKAYSGTFRTLCNVPTLRTLPYSELYHIQNFGIFRPEAYSEFCSYRHIQAYSGIFNNDSYNNIFFTLILHTFHRNLKKHVFWLQWRQFQCSTEST